MYDPDMISYGIVDSPFGYRICSDHRKLFIGGSVNERVCYFCQFATALRSKLRAMKITLKSVG